MLLCTQEETPGIGIGTERSTAEEFLGTAGIVKAAEWKGSAASGAGTPLWKLNFNFERTQNNLSCNRPLEVMFLLKTGLASV